METLNQIDKMGADLLAKMPEYLQAGTKIAGELLEKFITWRLAYNYAAIIMLIGIMIALIVYIKKAISAIKKDSKEDIFSEDEAIALWVFIVLGSLASIVLFICAIITIPPILQLHFFPEMYIIEYFVK